MTTIDLSLEQTCEIFKRQNGLCALTGKKFESETSDEFQIFNIHPEIESKESDNLILVWKNAELSSINQFEIIHKDTRKYYFQFANFQHFDSSAKIDEFNKDFALIKEFSTNDEKLKVSITYLKNLIKLSQNLNIDESILKPFINEVLEFQRQLEEKLSKIRSQINEESNKFFDLYNLKIEELKNIPSNWQNLRNSRQKLLNLQSEITSAKVKISKNTVDELKKHIANALTLIAQKQIAERENYEMECSDNYLQLRSQIDNFLPTLENSAEYSKLRQNLIEIQKLISKKVLKRNHQEELYQTIRNYFEKLTSRQDSDKQSFVDESNTNYEMLKPIVENAISIANSTDTFKEARETLIAAQASIKGLTLTKEQRDELYGKIRGVFEGVNKLQEEERGEFLKISEENYAKLLEKIQHEKSNLSDNPHFKTIRENLLIIQGEIRVMKLKTDHRNRLFDALKAAFVLLDEKRNSFFQNQSQNKKNKTDSYARNLKEKLTKLEEAVEIDKNELASLEKKLHEFTDEYEKVEILASIDAINSMITEKEKRIEETKERIKE
jgi:DNA repair exonuclease SbcCD ATPase subunit